MQSQIKKWMTFWLTFGCFKCFQCQMKNEGPCDQACLWLTFVFLKCFQCQMSNDGLFVLLLAVFAVEWKVGGWWVRRFG